MLTGYWGIGENYRLLGRGGGGVISSACNKMQQSAIHKRHTCTMRMRRCEYNIMKFRKMIK